MINSKYKILLDNKRDLALIKNTNEDIITIEQWNKIKSQSEFSFGNYKDKIVEKVIKYVMAI